MQFKFLTHDIQILKVPENSINMINFNNIKQNVIIRMINILKKINYPYPSLVCFPEKFRLDV